MVELIGCVIWAIGGYSIAKKMKETHKDLKINPMLYGVGTLFFSFLLTMSFLGWKVCEHTGNNKGVVISIIVFILTIIFNLVALL